MNQLRSYKLRYSLSSFRLPLNPRPLNLNDNISLLYLVFLINCKFKKRILLEITSIKTQRTVQSLKQIHLL